MKISNRLLAISITITTGIVILFIFTYMLTTEFTKFEDYHERMSELVVKELDTLQIQTLLIQEDIDHNAKEEITGLIKDSLNHLENYLQLSQTTFSSGGLIADKMTQEKMISHKKDMESWLKQIEFEINNVDKSESLDHEKITGYLHSLKSSIMNAQEYEKEMSMMFHAQFNEKRNFLFSLLFTIFLSVVAITLFLILSLHRDTKKYLNKIIEATKEFSKNNFTYRINLNTKNEYNTVAAAFNDMAKSIGTQTEELKKLNLAKDEFMAMITHELKTPLVPILGYLDMVLTGKFGNLNEEQKKRLDVIKSNASSLLNLIQDILDAQKSELGQLKMNFERLDLTNIIQTTVEGLDAAFEKKEITLRLDLKPVLCFCDKKRIKQVINNLMMNAIDFSQTHGLIEIKLFSENDNVFPTKQYLLLFGDENSGFA